MRVIRVMGAAAVIALMAGPAFAQQKTVPRYGEEDKAKTQSELASEKDAERAYKRSLGSVPDKGPVDPWGTVRADTPKPAAAKETKKTKVGGDAK
jgi:hypothetical protein